MNKEQEDRLREQTLFYVLGYGKWINWQELEPDTLPFVQKYWEEGNEVIALLAAGAVTEAVTALREGPWSAQDLGQLLPELDRWALLVSSDRYAKGPMDEETLAEVRSHGLETYHDALLLKHAASVEATEALQAVLEVLGLELLDTGAMYSATGEQEGARDLVMGVPGTETEYAFRVWHSPRKAETEDTLPNDVEAAVRQWEVVA